MTKTIHHNDVINRIGLVYAKTLLNCRDISEWVRSMTKTRYENDVIDCIGVVNAKTEIELLKPFEPGAICYLN